MPREPIFLECTKCGTRYYRTTKNTTAQPGKTSGKIGGEGGLKKFCRECRVRVPHKERKK